MISNTFTALTISCVIYGFTDIVPIKNITKLILSFLMTQIVFFFILQKTFYILFHKVYKHVLLSFTLVRLPGSYAAFGPCFLASLYLTEKLHRHIWTAPTYALTFQHSQIWKHMGLKQEHHALPQHRGIHSLLPPQHRLFSWPSEHMESTCLCGDHSILPSLNKMIRLFLLLHRV